MAKTKDTVQYRPVEGLPGYRVGKDGSVWSCWRQVGFGYGGGSQKIIGNSWRRLTATRINDRGYRGVNLYPGPRMRLVHRLILEAFIGPCPPGLECCHWDGNPANNALSNLRWDTRENNIADAVRHGTFPRGTKCHAAKLTAAKVLAIRANYSSGLKTQKVLAAEFGVGQAVISGVVRRLRWRHV